MQFSKGIINVIQLTILAMILSLVSMTLYAEIKKPLRAEQAFIFSAKVQNPQKIIVQWKIAPNYYLYRKHFHFTFTPNLKNVIHYPKGEWKLGLDRGRTEVYSGLLQIPIAIQDKTSTVKIEVEYQGCSKKGFCYPPLHKKVELTLSIQTPEKNNPDSAGLSAPTSKSLSLHSLLTNQNGVQELMHSQYFIFLLLLFVLLGLVLAFTPCVLPMIPILTGIIVGQKNTDTKRSFYLSLTYVLGTSFTYAGVGLFAAAMGSSLQTWLQRPLVIGLVSLIFVLLAISLFGFYHLRLPSFVQNPIHNFSNKHQGGNYFGVFCMGAISTLIVSPCVTAPLIGVLMYIAQTGNMLFGASALFAMGIGMGIPLLLIGTTAGKWLPKSGPWMEAVKISCGFMMLAMAIWLLSRFLSHSVSMMLWGLLLVGVAIFFGIYLPRFIGKRIFNRGLGVLVGFSGMLLMFGGAGLSNPLMPINVQQLPIEGPGFALVHDVHDFEQRLFKARNANQPVIVDFYADWCESCVAMDKNVFNKNSVHQKLKNYLLLRVDLSANNANDAELLKYFDVIAPPTVLFFNNKGHEVNSQRIVGEVDAKEFLARIKNAG